MVSLSWLPVLAALAVPGDTVLLDFTAPWCGPCQQMEPTIGQLVRDGYPVRKINIDQQRALAQQFRVDRVPCYILVSGGREIDRVFGATGIDRLKQMYQRAGFSPGAAPASMMRGQSPDRDIVSQPASRFVSQPSVDDSKQAQDKALAASVRLKIRDPRGHSYGSGTIVDSHNEEALILTCGHIFRDSAGKGEIQIDVFAGGRLHSVQGRLIRYDLKRDIGLVAARLPVKIAPMQVVSKAFRARVGEPVFSIGCDRGAPPKVVQSRMNSINKYQGPDNFIVAGQPIDGRSGGGLFNRKGQLIGVCNAADPADNEGLYAAAATIQAELDAANLSFIYQAGSSSESIAADTKTLNQPLIAPAMPRRMPSGASAPAAAAQMSQSEQAILKALRNPSGQVEIMCIVQGDNQQSRREVIVLDRPSPEFLGQLRTEFENRNAAMAARQSTDGMSAMR